jgi:hypothetical protein
LLRESAAVDRQALLVLLGVVPPALNGGAFVGLATVQDG